MGLDPRWDAVEAHKQGGGPWVALRSLEERVRSLEDAATIPALTGTPTADAPDGSAAITPTPRLWLRVDGSWRYVTLT